METRQVDEREVHRAPAVETAERGWEMLRDTYERDQAALAALRHENAKLRLRVARLERELHRPARELDAPFADL